LLAVLGLLTWQILLPGFIGLANNGDFPKVAGRLSLGGTDGNADNFLYFEPDYLREPRWYWNSELPTSELLLAWISTVIPSAIQKHLRAPREFDIRWLGALHVVLWMVGYSLLLRSIRSLNGILWWIAALASLWIFMDVSYLAYFNSFYTDTAALLGAMTAISLVPILLAQSGAARTVAIVSFGAGALLYVTSKGQHAAFAPILAALLAWIAWIAARKSAKIAASATAVALMSGSIWAFVGTPSWYRSQSRFNLIFARILPESANPAQDAQELGLAPADLRYIGVQSYLPGTPVDNPQWLAGFSHRGGYASVLRFYLRHPAVPFRYLWNDLRIDAVQMRALNLSNFQRRDGRPAGAKTNRMASWSNLRSWLLAPADSLGCLVRIRAIGIAAASAGERRFSRSAREASRMEHRVCRGDGDWRISGRFLNGLRGDLQAPALVSSFHRFHNLLHDCPDVADLREPNPHASRWSPTRAPQFLIPVSTVSRENVWRPTYEIDRLCCNRFSLRHQCNSRRSRHVSWRGDAHAAPRSRQPRVDL
jgi:hypothetical protein